MRYASLIGMLTTMMRREGAMPNIPLAQQRAPKGHTWGGRRTKLKKRRQDHQRNVSPSRRH